MLVEIKTVNKEEVTVVTSLDVAETFGKEHKRVITIRLSYSICSFSIRNQCCNRIRNIR